MTERLSSGVKGQCYCCTGWSAQKLLPTHRLIAAALCFLYHHWMKHISPFTVFIQSNNSNSCERRKTFQQLTDLCYFWLWGYTRGRGRPQTYRNKQKAADPNISKLKPQSRSCDWFFMKLKLFLWAHLSHSFITTEAKILLKPDSSMNFFCLGATFAHKFLI